MGIKIRCTLLCAANIIYIKLLIFLWTLKGKSVFKYNFWPQLSEKDTG